VAKQNEQKSPSDSPAKKPTKKASSKAANKKKIADEKRRKYERAMRILEQQQEWSEDDSE